VGLKRTVESLVVSTTPTDIAAIEGELSKLERRRAQLAESLDAATDKALQLSAERRQLIIDNRDQRILDKANAKVREAEEQRVALDDALRALDEKIAEATKRFEAIERFGGRTRTRTLDPLIKSKRRQICNHFPFPVPTRCRYGPGPDTVFRPLLGCGGLQPPRIDSPAHKHLTVDLTYKGPRRQIADIPPR
jgi:hypothetical protein